jgi:hypothetical protein
MRLSRLPGLAVVTSTVLALVVPVAGPSSAAPPTEPQCLPLGAGTTGLLVVGGAGPSPDQVAGERGGFGAPAPPRVARSLPDTVTFKTNRETFSNEYAFALRGGRIYVRPAKVGRGTRGEPWRVLEVPSCLDGTVTAISADHRFLTALGPGRQLYSHDMPGGDLSAERWTWRWGPYFWTGSGMTMFPDVRRWATSELTSAETFTDSSGRRQQPIGVGTVYLLRGEDPRRITYLDPWLPQDESREVCGPQRSTLHIANLSASGSMVFVVGRQGELFTRLYDFDVSGANTVFGDYSWERGRPASDTRWQLPGPRWVRHAPPPGRVTDRISIAKTGPDASDRLLRVEGRDVRGRRVVWQKRIDDRTWRVAARGSATRGRLLPLTGLPEHVDPPQPRFVGSIDGARTVVPAFHPECSPSTLRVRVAEGVRLPLVLHSADGLRQEARERGLTDVPREYNGAVEVPAAVWRTLDDRPRLRRWVEEHLDGRFTTAPLAVTGTRMRFLSQCWELTLDGKPARPDQPAVPPDLGAVVGRLTEMHKDGRTPSVCAQ